MVSLPQENYLAEKTSLPHENRLITKYLYQYTFRGNKPTKRFIAVQRGMVIQNKRNLRHQVK